LDFRRRRADFPTKGTCLAIYSRAVNAEQPLNKVLRDHFPWCAGWEAQLHDLFGSYVEAKQAQNVLDYDDLLLYWAETIANPLLPLTSETGSTTFWSTSIRTPIVSSPRSFLRSSLTGQG
jgi:hypothetical protein